MKKSKNFHEHSNGLSNVSKTIKSIVLVVLIAFSSVVSASTNPENIKEKTAEPSVITQEVGKLLQSPSFEIEKEIVASVTLTVNKNNEMVVLSVDTEDDTLERFIKSRLNYNVLPSNAITKEKTFVVPVRLQVEE